MRIKPIELAIVCAMLLSVGYPLAAAPVSVQSALRDPTAPPAALSISNSGMPRVPGTTITPQHIVSVNGKRYLLWQSRRYAVGDTLDGARLDRITESEIWLRRASGVQKINLYTGIEKRAPIGDSSAITSTRKIVDGKKGNTK